MFGTFRISRKAIIGVTFLWLAVGCLVLYSRVQAQDRIIATQEKELDDLVAIMTSGLLTNFTKNEPVLTIGK